MTPIELVFTPYDRSNWTQGDEASLDHCAWHGKTGGRHSPQCSVELIWTIQAPDGRKFGACENAGHDVLRTYAQKLK